MHIVLFCQSLMSDWSHGNAHFLRGVVTELMSRGNEVTVYEPVDELSGSQLRTPEGANAEERFQQAFPTLTPIAFDLNLLSLEAALPDTDLIIVHESIEPRVVARIGRHKAAHGRYVLLFHDTHHRALTTKNDIECYDLRHFDGVLAFGEIIRERYLQRGWSRQAWTWHEAADIRVFQPLQESGEVRDVVWVGNWGDEARSAEISNFFVEPVRELRLTATAYGARYPDPARRALRSAGIDYKGRLPNYDVPLAYASHRFTVDIPSRSHVSELPGVPTMRLFEALACGIPLVSLDWRDVEGLFTPGLDFLVARTPREMRDMCVALAADDTLRKSLARHGLETIRRRHTCAHRVDELLSIFHQLRGGPRAEVMTV